MTDSEAVASTASRLWWSSSARAARERQVETDDSPFSVGKERVVAATGREGPLGQTQEHHAIELDPYGDADRSDHHPRAEAAVAAEVVLELEGEGAAKGGHGWVGIDVVEIAEPIDGGFDPVGGSAFVVGPTLAKSLATHVRAHQTSTP